MCCLGFYGLSCGFTSESMNGGGTLTGKFLGSAVPDWLMKKLDSKDGKRFHKTGADVENALAELNDKERGIHPSRRESAIAYLFKKYGDVNVTFTGKYAVATKKAKDYIEEGVK